MRNLQTIEKSAAARSLVTPLLAVTLGGAMVASGSGGKSEQTSERLEPSMATVSAVGHAGIDSTVTGRVETLYGEPLVVTDGPFGDPKGEYKDGSKLQVKCQASGMDTSKGLPGTPHDYGKPDLFKTTWYKLGMVPDERWVPSLPVFTDNPIPSCPR